MIVSTTLTANRAGVIGAALASVIEQVDRCLVIDTGVTDDTLAVARQVAGDKLHVVAFPWVHDFSAARNFALQSAHDMGASWAMTLDTDERLSFVPEFDLRAVLRARADEALLVAYEGGSYAKERLFRLPAKGRWSGPTHEAYIGPRGGILPGVTFTELPKDAMTLQRKFQRDANILGAHTSRNPGDPRWHYYLGASLHDLGRFDAAIQPFLACAALRGWDEEGAWACYRAAECYGTMGRWNDAIETCAKGLALRPATAELAWLAAVASMKSGRYVSAIAWANMAIANGLYNGTPYPVERIGFRNLVALYEGPYEVLRQCYERLGDEGLAESAARTCQHARRTREREQA